MTVMAAETTAGAAEGASAARIRPASSGGSFRGSAVSATRSSRQFAHPEFRNYQGIILVEFIVAELLVAGTPIATRKNQPGLSPYIPRDMTKLLSLGMVYFLLELLSVTGRSGGRFGAWFGGLVLIAVGLNEASNVVKVLDIFGGSQQQPTGQAQVNLPTGTAPGTQPA